MRNEDAELQTKLETWLDLVREGDWPEEKFWAKHATLLQEHGLSDPLADSHQ